jgi:hypothetical protein
MKNFLWFLLIIFIISSCNQHEGNKNSNLQVNVKNHTDSSRLNLSINKEKNAEDLFKETILPDTLIPTEILNKGSKDIFEKYGLEFEGNCYDCDLAYFKIEKKRIKIICVCASEICLEYNIINSEITRNKFSIKTQYCEFIFTQIETIPIYELSMSGKKIKNKNLRIVKYYTLKSILPKFKVHDCGDFQG